MFSNPENLLIVLLIVVVLFGAKRLPGLGRGLGQGMREFKDGITGASKPEDDEEVPAISRASAVPPATPERPREPADAGTEHRA
ncbi:MAG TPA: twin-arginine translocase TatA/TatE family subunit [Solirubrobacteraceae bacterium]|jgi:sec-independent protein translocase protein TatA|nr:twin-arginine translocase TatA/TatE family subunit [Solirubrobacteraceae bacterium]